MATRLALSLFWRFPPIALIIRGATTDQIAPSTQPTRNLEREQAMAKKKKKKAKKKTKSPTAKARGKSGRLASSKPSTKPKASSKKSSGGSRSNSVDGVLKKYQKERQTQEVQLATMRKKIEDLEAKTRAFREQIGKLTEQENGLQKTISQLDARRDQEVSNLLAKLGVQLRAGGSVIAGSTTDNKPSIQTSAGDMRNQPD
jgi:chromosome segregation ATPase